MALSPFLLALDQGTTSTRAIMFDAGGVPHAIAQEELGQIFPQPGWVEHDADEIWQASIKVCREAMAAVGATARDVAAIGITNQRETTVLWDRETGEPLYNAIVWQDRRTADLCDRLIAEGLEPTVRERTGLLIDPYFSATKLAWLLEHVDGARARAHAGRLAFGTVDSFLLWRLTGGVRHASDATNAARTMLFDIRRQAWDDSLLSAMGIPAVLLPEVCDNAGDFGTTDAALFGGGIRIAGMAGDQQAATVGQACLAPGMAKCTFGTGCFALMNTGEVPVTSRNRLLSTIAYRLRGQATYAVEGSVFNAGTAIQWLRDGLGVIRHASESEALARTADAKARVYMVPAFTGLGAPYWDAGARGAFFGLTRDTGRGEIVRAALEAVCFQTRDLLDAMAADGARPPTALRVDGGMIRNGWAMQFLADILDLPVELPRVLETTALGAAQLAAVGAGLRPALDATAWMCEQRFEPAMAAGERSERYGGWRDAVARVRSR